jgi:hypothetical protein
MTVCIAATCVDDDGNQRIVLAADRMVTYPSFIEFEHTVPKFHPASTLAVTMVAGDVLIGTRLARETAEAMAGTNPPMGLIANQLALNYEAVRNQWVESQVLAPRGLNFQTFYQNHNSLNPQVTGLIDQSMTQYDLQIELLLAGVDSTGAHMYTVHNPGRTPRQHDVVGYAGSRQWMDSCDAVDDRLPTRTRRSV